MPRAATQVRHAAVTDHRIPRSPESAPKHVSHANVSPDWSPFIAFRPLSATGEDKAQTPGKSAEEMDAAGAPGGGDTRNLGLAIVLAMGRRDNIVDDRMLLRASRLLAEAVERNPDDVPARQGYALALAETGEPAQALRELEEVLRRQPTRESALAAAGSILSRAQNWSTAERVWRKARDVNPWIVRYWTELALCQARQRRWDACRSTCEETLARFPDSFGARQLLIECQLVAGQADEAQREYERLLAIGPPKADSIRRWWQEHPLRRKPPPQP
jgi:tetratricopeptide (TPR) repeat protein